ncbi:hypothetical protein KKJ25_13595 [Xenorhabdus bovienii]|uniref:hypothetical protein n=1 Tax=Xenorhabdus bovienii TaxID=40576 RepID=UPI00237C7F49|nr:hypothetical protein [Xenorhabdus bovienii]MDE1495941.1 hypothetical protein [Xenorhabdus bovienii]MDE9473975.1 hypothetical protein [Xenorhabdus bovienii]
MSSAKIINAYFNASEEERKEFLRVLSQFYKDNRRVPLQDGMESFSVNESIRKSRTINFAPMQGGCPVCGK